MSEEVKVTDINIVPAINSADRPSVGNPTTVEVTVGNRGSSSTTEPLTLSVNGTAVVSTKLALDAGERRVWEPSYTFETAGMWTVSVGERSRDVSVDEGLQPEVSTTVNEIAASRESRPRGIAEVKLAVENPHNRPVFFSPTVEIGGERATVELTGSAARNQDADAAPPTSVSPGAEQYYIARRVLPADGEYSATVDGDRVGTTDLHLRDTPYRLGTPARTGSRMPSGGIGTEPQLVTEFSFGQPDRRMDFGGLAEARFDHNIEEVLRIRIQAVAGDKIYLTFWWRTEDKVIWSTAALDRWTGESAWHIRSAMPEIAVVDGVEYLLTATSEERMGLLAKSNDGTGLWRRMELTVPEQHLRARNLVPAGDSLYVSTAEGVAEIARESGERRRTLPGVFPVVGDEAVYTFGGEGPLARFPRDGATTTPEWERTPGDGTTDTSVVAGGRVYVTAYVHGEKTRDDRIELHAYDAESGKKQWTDVVSRARTVGGLVSTPDFGGLLARQGFLMWGGESGIEFVDLDTGGHSTSRVGGGRASTPQNPFRTYGVNDEEFLVSEATGESTPPTEHTVPLPEPVSRQDGSVSMLYGRGVMYVANKKGVYGFSGGLPDGYN